MLLRLHIGPDRSETVISEGPSIIISVLSTTVTIAVLLATLPLGSVTVSVTVFSPILEQLKSVMSRVIVAIEQLSEEAVIYKRRINTCRSRHIKK